MYLCLGDSPDFGRQVALANGLLGQRGFVRRQRAADLIPGDREGYLPCRAVGGTRGGSEDLDREAALNV
jgi:hypothetical protein